MQLKPGTYGVHPRLIFSKEDIGALQTACEADGRLRQELGRLRQAAEELLRAPFLSEEYANAVYSQHGNYYEIGAQISDFAQILGFLYQLTGEKRYAEKLKDALLHYASFAAWTGPSNKDRKTPWHSDLSTTRILYGFALGYDCILDVLSPQEEAAVRLALLEKGVAPLLRDWVLPQTRIHALDSMGHNWWAVCIGFAGVGLSAIYEKVDRAEEWMSGIVEALRGFCAYRGELLLNKPANFDDRGMFYESARYFNYGIGELMRFIFVFRRCFADKALVEFPELELSGSALMAMSYPTKDEKKPFLFANFGDSFSTEDLHLLPMLLLIEGGGSLLRSYYRSVKTKWDLYDFIYRDRLWAGDGRRDVPPDTIQHFPGSGYLFVRSSWEPNATMLGVRCGFTWNHAHDDAGSFLLFDNGAPLLVDSGTISYSDPLYRSYYTGAQAHNIVLVDQKGQAPENIGRGSKFPGAIPRLLTSDWATYALADATGPMADRCSRNYRSFFWLDGDILIVIDDLRTYEPARFDFLLHYAGRGKSEGHEMTIENQASRLKATVLFPENGVIGERQGYLECPPDRAQKTSSASYFEAAAPALFRRIRGGAGAGPAVFHRHAAQ